jgi:hypothetical protein
MMTYRGVPDVTVCPTKLAASCLFKIENGCTRCQKCAYCGSSLYLNGSRKNFTWDHVLAYRSRGRTLVPCCRTCNESKHTKIIPSWLNHLTRTDRTLLRKILEYNECRPSNRVTIPITSWYHRQSTKEQPLIEIESYGGRVHFDCTQPLEKRHSLLGCDKETPNEECAKAACGNLIDLRNPRFWCRKTVEERRGILGCNLDSAGPACQKTRCPDLRIRYRRMKG